jgi:hypothetical protein
VTAPVSEAVSSRRNRWHQSTLSTLLDGCSWQYFLTYVLEIEGGVKPHAAVGTAFHSAVELHEKGRMEGRDVTLKEMIEHAEEALAAVIEDEEMFAKLRAAVRNWWENHRDYLLKFTPIAIEPEFTIPLVDGARPIGGYIDGVYRDDETGRYFIVDQKTAKDFSRWKDAEGHRFQAAMYAAALVLSPDFPEITELPEMRYLVVRTSRSSRANFEPARILDIQPDLEDVRVLGERIRIAEKMVKSEAFVRKPEWILCSEQWCPYYEGCMVTQELAGTPAQVRLRLGERQQLS